MTKVKFQKRELILFYRPQNDLMSCYRLTICRVLRILYLENFQFYERLQLGRNRHISIKIKPPSVNYEKEIIDIY